MTTQPTFIYSATVGTITALGVYTAPYATASATLTATTGSLSDTAAANTTNAAPTVATAAAASPGTVTATTTALSVLGADSDGGGQSKLTYSWACSSLPSGAAPPTFSANNTNAAQNTTVTFAALGSYTFTTTITDSGGLSTTSSVSVSVSQTATSLVISPASSVVNTSATEQFSVSLADQFGNAMAGSSQASNAMGHQFGFDQHQRSFHRAHFAGRSHDHGDWERFHGNGHRSGWPGSLDEHVGRVLGDGVELAE